MIFFLQRDMEVKILLVSFKSQKVRSHYRETADETAEQGQVLNINLNSKDQVMGQPNTFSQIRTHFQYSRLA